ncbi:major facilitator superfamily domain-containing protein [Aspergillus stella-maris]|uniref:major facilitator superfamily domain-containing protein n=1 Tax=Aspergillus stella-maris TaxID=1810926 RepID=UPI003CCD75DE
MSHTPPLRRSASEVEPRTNTNAEIKSTDKHIEFVSETAKPQHAEGAYISPGEIQMRFDLLRDLTPEQIEALNKRVLRRIDWHMMPCVTLMFLMNYLDRINVSNARLAGLQEDLNMSDTVWSAGISTFYVGYLVGQLPGNMIMAKTNPQWFLPITMLLWSSGTICMPAMTNGAGFCAVRFFIGLTEAPFFPALTLLTSSWYTKEESPIRMAIWHAGNTISNIISGFLAAGILENMDGIGGLHAWQWFFLIEGIVSIVVAAAAFMFLPAWPHNTKFLTDEESEMAQYRVLLSNGGRDETVGGTWDGLKDAVKDPFTWFFCLMHFSLVTAQSFKDFLPSILQTFGFDTMTTYLVQAPPYAIAYAFACVAAWSCGRLQESTWHIVIPIIISAAGCSILISTLNVGARYFGIILLICGTYSGLNLQLSWETTVVPSPRSKKAALIAIANCISQCSHWFSPYFYPTSQEPYYRMGGGLVLMGCALVAVSAFAVNWRGRRLNKKLDEAEGWTPHSGNERGWRYRL